MPAMVPQNLMPTSACSRLAQHAVPAEHHQQRDAGDGVRHRQRQVDRRGDHALARKRRARQQHRRAARRPARRRRRTETPLPGSARSRRARRPCARPRRGSLRIALPSARPAGCTMKVEQDAAEEPTQQEKAARTAWGSVPPPPACCHASHRCNVYRDRCAHQDPGHGIDHRFQPSGHRLGVAPHRLD